MMMMMMMTMGIVMTIMTVMMIATVMMMNFPTFSILSKSFQNRVVFTNRFLTDFLYTWVVFFTQNSSVFHKGNAPGPPVENF